MRWKLLTIFGCLGLVAGCEIDNRFPDEPEAAQNPTASKHYGNLTALDGSGVEALAESWPRAIPSQPGRAPNNLREVHARGIQDFILAPGFGYERMPPVHISPSELYLQRYGAMNLSDLSSIEGIDRWRIGKLNLIGVVREPEGVVYSPGTIASHGVRPVARTGSVSSRKLDATEATAIAAMRSGENLLIEEAAGQHRLFGAIRAAAKCAACHKVETGTLLGALSYDLQSSEAAIGPLGQSATR